MQRRTVFKSTCCILSYCDPFAAAHFQCQLSWRPPYRQPKNAWDALQEWRDVLSELGNRPPT